MKIVKIMATGSYKRFMWLELGEKTYCVRINNELYYVLKTFGVSTSQSLMKKYDSKM